jgi:hypothetical protein
MNEAMNITPMYVGLGCMVLTLLVTAIAAYSASKTLSDVGVRCSVFERDVALG